MNCVRRNRNRAGFTYTARYYVEEVGMGDSGDTKRAIKILSFPIKMVMAQNRNNVLFDWMFCKFLLNL